MFIWDILTIFTDVLDIIFGLLTGVVSLLATLSTLNERLLLFLIDSVQTGTDEVYNIIEFLEKLFTCQLSSEDFGSYGLETVLETLNNNCGLIAYWCLGVFQQCLTPLPISVCSAIVFAVLSVIHRRRLIQCLKYLLPNQHNLFVIDANDDREDDWNANGNLGLDNHDHALRAETLDEVDASSDSDVASHPASTEVNARTEHHSQLHNRGVRTSRESSVKNNVDNKRCSKLRSQDDRLLCVICQDKSKSVLVLPCRHLCMCEACAKVISSDVELPKICPLCRTAISRLVNVYV